MRVTRGPEMDANEIQAPGIRAGIGSPPNITRAAPRGHLKPRARTQHARSTPPRINEVWSKRVIDVVGAIVALIVFSPVFVVTAIAVYLTDRGPILFKQTRVGADGRHFEIIKFRSMCIDAERRLHADGDLRQRYLANGCKVPANEDDRVSRVGRFLRTSSLDEIPQFWNVLRGDMSLVGPRPVLPWELTERYASARAHYVSTRPGITGAWQVSGRSDLGYDRRLALDVRYVENWSLRHDLAILARTPIVVASRHGAH